MISALKTVLLTLLLLLLVVGSGLAEPIIIKFSHVVGQNTPKGKASEYLKRLIEQRSNDRIKVEIYADGALFDDWAVQEALTKNVVQMAAPSFSKLSGVNPQLQLFGLPFLFEDIEHLHRVVDGDIGTELLKSSSRNGLFALAFWDNGFKQLTANQKLINPQDAAGLRFRIEGSKVLQAQYAALDATSRTIPFPMLYTALAKNEVDGQENTLSNIYNEELYRVQSDLTISNHGYLGYLVLTNDSFWSQLPEDLKVIVRGALKDATEYIREMAVKLNNDALQEIRATDAMKIHVLTSTEKEIWRTKLKGIYTDLHNQISEDLIHKVQEARTK